MISEKKICPRRNALPVTCHLSLVTLVLLGGCGTRSLETFYDQSPASGANYVTFEYPFTDAGAEDARKRAERQCAHKKQVPVVTKHACTLDRCTTSFQCMAPAEAAGAQSNGAKK